jgi:hypothetical protein
MTNIDGHKVMAMVYMNTTRSGLCYPQINLMDCVEDYARKWTKPEHEVLDTLSEWVKRVRSLMQIRIKKTQWVNKHSHNTNLLRPICC